MPRDVERVQRITRALVEAQLDAVVCALPANVLLLSGYWPVVGTACAIVTRDGQVAVVTPRDEQRFAERGWADVVVPFEAGSLHDMPAVVDAVAGPLGQASRSLGLEGGRLGYEAGAWFEPATYASMFLYGGAMEALLQRSIPHSRATACDAMLVQLRSVKTAAEVARIAAACRVAASAFAEGARQLRAGLEETEAAECFRAPLSGGVVGHGDVVRADGFVYCMSGANSALAHAAYARSSGAALEPGRLVLVHCNSYVDGFWTDITRTYHLGEPEERSRRMYDAVFAARAAALSAIRPGVRAADVDRAARDVLAARGFGDAFKHSTGHGVGFAAINHNARPRLHPASGDTLESGMVFNVEPAVYFDGYGGLRQCDVVAATDEGCELLTPFQGRVEELMIG
ncbi:MAG TPA: Xaa-Pro peptidase family protein [Gemmatimonadaceae bacterium]|nr:Xaa-Pro peptidase family protein [Gemmatimonadaceae bacterium]